MRWWITATDCATTCTGTMMATSFSRHWWRTDAT
jgi:hypothetical protein